MILAGSMSVQSLLTQTHSNQSLSKPRPPSYVTTNVVTTSPPKRLGTNLFETLPAPGVYQSYPYSCIIVVPGPHPDDKCIIGRGDGSASKMPTVRPELRLVPLDQVHRAPPQKQPHQGNLPK